MFSRDLRRNPLLTSVLKSKKSFAMEEVLCVELNTLPLVTYNTIPYLTK